MKFWVFVCNDSPLEYWLDNIDQRFDAWSAAGVEGIVVGRMLFRQPDGTQIRAYAPDPAVYAAHGEQPPEAMPRDLEKEKKLQAMLDNAAGRGWPIMIFGGGTPGVLEDLLHAFPKVSGFITDGPGEQHYELEFHHGGELFELRPGEDARFAKADADIGRIQNGIAHLRQSFRNLTPDRVRYHAAGGMLASLLLFDVNEDALYWLRMRQEVSRLEWQQNRQYIDSVGRNIKLGGIPRTAAFSSLTGQNYQQMEQYFDLIFPKHYYWHRGFDGLYGTVARWVKRLGRWNPSLTEADCFAVVKALFGIDLPEVQSLDDMDQGFPDAFFSDLVFNETRRALDAFGDADRVLCWVSTGRHPHGGDAMPVRDLRGILEASQQAGLKRFLYHPEPDFGAAEWRLLSSMCGQPWDEDPRAFWPGGTPHPHSWNGGRVVPDED